ncbi:hypothetical protein [Bacillus salipaludis]|uniref:Uncharacterized protein n=1 Tax=Bacillus salipaludis TaxID=2547811 RepID=A0AA90TWG5_9BACI|nr:hypothetical protein [Bacillus salipaludis]MDQ6600739.1 hypothetical protein [Bacillus salipaludis]
MDDLSLLIEKKIEDIKSEIVILKDKIINISTNDEKSVISYFNFSMNFTKDDSEENILFCDFVIQNNTNMSLKNPIILIKINSINPTDFLGRFFSKTIIDEKAQWERVEVEEMDEKSDYWLKSKQTTLKPKETLVFPGFQIKWAASHEQNIHVSGFFYCDQFKKGITSLNSVSINI